MKVVCKMCETIHACLYSYKNATKNINTVKYQKNKGRLAKGIKIFPTKGKNHRNWHKRYTNVCWVWHTTTVLWITKEYHALTFKDAF